MEGYTREDLEAMCSDLDYHLVQSAEDLTEVEGDPHRYGYHWTDSRYLPLIRQHGLGQADPHRWASDHELAYLYCMGTGESADYVQELLAKQDIPDWHGWRASAFEKAVCASLEMYFKNWYRAWFSFDPKASSGWGDTQIRIDLEKLGNWIAKNHVETFMFPDYAYGYGLFMEKRIPVECLRWKGK